MPIYKGMFFETREELDAYLKIEQLKKDFPKLQFTSRIDQYIKELELPTGKQQDILRERVGMGLFGKVADFFISMWANVWVTLGEALSSIVSDIMSYLVKSLYNVTIGELPKFASNYLDKTDLPLTTKQVIKSEVNTAGLTGNLVTILVAFMSRLAGVMGYMESSKELIKQETNKQIRPTLADIGSILSARFRDPAFEPILNEQMDRMGFNEDIKNMYRIVSLSLLNPDEVKALFLRGEIEKSERDKRLQALGFREEDIKILEILYYPIPNAQDIIRFAVREAFTPSYIEKYQMLSDLPADFIKYANQQGISQFWAEKYWASHWELPSIQMGFEMLHRGVISNNELDGLLRALDVMPFWREKLKEISYYPYTRVDVRRMYKAGVLDSDDVYRNYLDLGYTPERAKNLTEFTIKDAYKDERDLTKADLLSMYERKLISKSECLNLLLKCGYSQDEADLYLNKVDYDVEKKIKDNKIKSIKSNYINSRYDDVEARNRLSALNLKGSEITELFEEWDIEREGRLKDLSFTQLQQLLINKVITQGDFLKELENAGYRKTYRTWLLELTKKKVVEG